MAIDDLNSTVNELILIDVYRIPHSTYQNTHSSQTHKTLSLPHLFFSFFSTLLLIFFAQFMCFVPQFSFILCTYILFFVLLSNVLQSHFIFVLFQFEKQQVLTSSFNSVIFLVIYNIFVAISTPLIWVFIFSDLYLSLNFQIGEIVIRYFCFYLVFYFVRLDIHFQFFHSLCLNITSTYHCYKLR